jgi:integrase
MLNNLPKTEKNVFGNVNLGSMRVTFCASRKRAAQKLQNPRLLEIHFHTFRHWKATVEYHKTKDVLYVMNFLGHKNVKNTMLYIQLEKALFSDISDDFTCRVARAH